ncbi:hypothetical protein [Curtobacterium sp. LFS082]
MCARDPTNPAHETSPLAEARGVPELEELAVAVDRLEGASV